MSSEHDRGTPAERATDGPVTLQRARLANGLELVVLENPVVPLATIEIDVHNGAYVETAAFDGLSHLYEHMFFKANERIPDQERYLRRTRELGMEWNGTTSEERVNYYFTLHSDRLAEGLQFMADAIRTPLFLPAELERERQVVIGEYDRAESDPGFHLHVAMGKALWRDLWVRKNVIGTRAVILATTPEQMFQIQRRFYVPNNSALIVAGAVEMQQVEALVTRCFGDWPAGPDPFAADPPPRHSPLAAPQSCVVEKPVNAASLCIAWHGPSVDIDPDGTYAADVLSFVLGQRNSRFYRRLVDSGLANRASLHYQTLRYTGPLQMSLVCAPDRFQEAHDVLRGEIARLADDDAFTDEELSTAKAQLEIDQVYDAERPSQLVHTLGYWWAVAGLEYYERYVERLRRIDRDAIRAFVHRYIHDRPAVTGVLVAPQDRARIGALDGAS
jgi:zinc protease